MSEPWTLEHAIQIAKIGGSWRSYPGTGSVWIGRADGPADVTFDDWGLAKASAVIINAVRDGRLVITEQPANDGGERGDRSGG